ncbi:MAG: hypothetical protein AAFQ38_15000 [Pseudomonadota bacterium]
MDPRDPNHPLNRACMAAGMWTVFCLISFVVSLPAAIWYGNLQIYIAASPILGPALAIVIWTYFSKP